MNSPLEQEYIEFEFSSGNKSCDDSTSRILKEIDDKICRHSVDDLPINLPCCEICGHKFLSKKELRAHILIHLGQPRIILKRIPNLKSTKKKHNDSYQLDPEKKGSLKLTLKRSKSEDFAVVNNNLALNTEDYYKEDVAGARESANKNGEETEKEIERPFENVTVNQVGNYVDGNFDTEEPSDPLEDNERPSMDTNEADSGVGSDTVNPSEKEDQAIDESQSRDDFNNPERTLQETEDPEDPEALEATYRQTIENLRKLGEQSSSRSASPLSNEPQVEEEEECAENLSNMVEQSEENSAVDMVSKSPSIPMASPHSNSLSEAEKEVTEPTDTNSNFNWNELSNELTNKSNEDSNKGEDNQHVDSVADGNIESAGSLLQNFLIEHQRRNQNETTLSNNLPPGETEYVSLEKLAETVSTCRVCNEKFKDIAQLDEHKSKAGHYQCNVPDCSNLMFNNPVQVAMHKAQVHRAPLSPSMNQLSPHLNTNSPNLSHGSPHLNTSSPNLSHGSPHLSANSPHAMPMDSPHAVTPPHMNKNSSMASPHQTNSPGFNNPPNAKQMISPVNFDQLPAPVQQLAQQVQSMPLPPQSQLPPGLPSGANSMCSVPNYFTQPPGRPPMYRVPGPQGMHYPPHLSHLYPQYGHAPGPYSQMPGPPHPPLHPQIPQQMQRGRYPMIMQNPRAQRMPQTGPTPRQRMKRPLPQPQQQNNPGLKQRRMDVLLPDRNEDADCHVIAQQKRNDGLPVIQNVQGATTQQSNRNDSTIHLTDSITLSVRQPGSTPAQAQNTSGSGVKKPDAKAVANVLASRGITVTPAANKNKIAEQNKQLQQQQLQKNVPASQPVNVTALNLNSAISIIPASSQRKQQQDQQGQFIVPQNRQNKAPNEMERPPRPPTVDLTQDGPPPPLMVRRGRPPRALLTCQVCDKSFQNQEILVQHMASHRATSKLLHKCNLCPAQYPTIQALATHKQVYHKEIDIAAQNGGAELALPVVDLKSPQVINRLSNLGIQSYIPLSQLSAQTGGYFGLPIVTIDGARNPNSCNLGALGATSILSLGPLKHLSNR